MNEVTEEEINEAIEALKSQKTFMERPVPHPKEEKVFITNQSI